MNNDNNSFLYKKKTERKFFGKSKISAFAIIAIWVWNSVGTGKETAASELLVLLTNSQGLLMKDVL